MVRCFLFSFLLEILDTSLADRVKAAYFSYLSAIDFRINVVKIPDPIASPATKNLLSIYKMNN